MESASIPGTLAAEDPPLPQPPSPLLPRPPSPPPAQAPSTASSREQTLSQHAIHLAARTRAQDQRAQELSMAEHRLSQQRTELHSRLAALDRLETGIRAEMAAFLSDLTARQESILKRENEHATAEADLRRRVSALRTVLRRDADVRRELHERRTELVELARRAEDAQLIIQEAQQRSRTVAEEKGAVDEANRKATADKAALARAADRLEAAETAVRRRETLLAEQEGAVQLAEARWGRFGQCAAVVAPLRSFLTEYAGLCAVDGQSLSDEFVPDESDPAAVATRALSVLRELRAVSVGIAKKRQEVERQSRSMADRERRVMQREKGLMVKEGVVKDTEVRLTGLRDEFKKREGELEDAWRAVDEAREENERREEAIRGRERALIQSEDAVRRREKGLEQSGKALARRERSIRRTLEAVTERERALEKQEQEIEEEKAALRALKTTIEMKENMLETRDLELMVREGKKNAAMDALLEASVKKRKRGASRLQHSVSTRESGSGPPSVPDTLVEEASVAPRGRTGRSEQSNKKPSPEEQAEVEPPVELPSEPAAPDTVRRQLAFDSTVPRGAQQKPSDNQDNAGSVGKGQPANPEGDDGSEAAADELLPELLSARGLWRERIGRLEAVVENMRETTWSLKPQVQPALSDVSSKLQEIRLQIEAPTQQGPESAKLSYMIEQQRQVQWGALMRAQLDIVRDLQAGMLISINREEDALAGGVLTQKPQEVVSESTGGTGDGSVSEDESRSTVSAPRRPSPGEESSVEATLDVTGKGGYMDEALDITEDLGAMATSFQEFRRTMQIRGSQERGNNGVYRGRVVVTRGSTRRLDGPASRRREAGIPSQPAILTDDANTGENLLAELAMIRNELQTITGAEPTAS